jgi:hypothetical protein
MDMASMTVARGVTDFFRTSARQRIHGATADVRRPRGLSIQLAANDSRSAQKQREPADANARGSRICGAIFEHDAQKHAAVALVGDARVTSKSCTLRCSATARRAMEPREPDRRSRRRPLFRLVEWQGRDSGAPGRRRRRGAAGLARSQARDHRRKSADNSCVLRKIVLSNHDTQ